MPFLQFLSGNRDQDVEELHATHSTYIGSGDEVQIKLADSGVQPQHCQLYPDPSGSGRYWIKGLGQGSTVIKMRRIGPSNPPDTVQLDTGEVFILGQTYVKFWPEKPPSGGGGGGGGGADPAALAQAQKELSAAKSELESLRAGSGRAGELEAELATSKQETESAKQETESAKQETESAKRETESAKRETESAKQETESAKRETESAQQETESAKQETESAKQETNTEREAHEATRQELESAKQATEAAQGELMSERTRLEGEVEAAKAEAERVVSEAQEAATKERAELDAALETTRSALSGLETAAAARDHDRLAAAAKGSSDLGAILDALQVSDALRSRVDQAVAAEVDREVIRRSAGSVVPLRGLSLPGSTRDLEAEVRAVRRHAEQVKQARDLGLADLADEELQRLLTLARS
jgi:DNA repair exonuclease SbcCD ATPase subunit